MVATLRHRGPDETGTFVDEEVSIGHARLSIIDLTKTGCQPMASDDGNMILSYNGEIYNFKDLRHELKSLGHKFSGTSDSEVFLYSYLEWGVGAFNRFNGMWAACIYDMRENCLILSRDRIGVKPLYYCLTQEGLLFASELKALLRHNLRLSYNRDAVDILLSTQFIPSPLTIFEGIFKVEPRQFLRWDIKKCTLTKDYYYNVPKYDPLHDYNRLIEMGRDLLDDAIQIRTVADVPVGAFLSGGIDSSVVVSRMRERITGDRLHTVSVGFDLPGLDESEYINLAKDTYETNHHHVQFKCCDIDNLGDLVASIYDEPVADPSTFPTLCLCQETRRWMTVALSGDGGDEVFGGYDGRRIVAQFVALRRIPRIIRAFLHGMLKGLHGYRITKLGRLAEALRVSLLDPSEYCAEIGATLVYRPTAFKKWAREKLRELLPLSRGNLVEAVMKFDIFYNRLGDNYAAKVDRISMSQSLEVRSPFLDYRFMEYASRIPVEWKVTARRNRVLMKDLLRGWIPDRIIDRKKHGFAAPLGPWVESHEDELREAVDELFEAGVLDAKWVQFFKTRVFEHNHTIYREYKKRLYFLWKWYRVWGSVIPQRGAGACVSEEALV